jgi:beta-galactosidase
MTARRETTGPAAKLVLRPDRLAMAADGEDAVVCVAEVQDAQGRVLPITGNSVTFKVEGPGEVIGTGNGDPTNHEPDSGSTRKAFAGLCMAIVQSAKTAGSITVEASSPGLASATAMIESRAVQPRPHVPVWEREVPAGPGATGLRRPASPIAAAQAGNPMALAGAAADMVITFRQDGSMLTGQVESSGGGGSTGGPIEDGKVNGAGISFRTGNTTYTGKITGGRIELQRSAPAFRRPGAGSPPPSAGAGPRPAIGPQPSGTDPSFGAGFGGRGGQIAPPLTLRRAPEPDEPRSAIG